MKTLLSMFIILALSGCFEEAPIINGPEPFVVIRIEERSNNMSLYTGRPQHSSSVSETMFVPSIVLPKGAFNIGDTIKF